MNLHRVSFELFPMDNLGQRVTVILLFRLLTHSYLQFSTINILKYFAKCLQKDCYTKYLAHFHILFPSKTILLSTKL